MMNLNDVDKSFIQGKNEINVLKKLNLNIEKGETVAILGPSGSGKSTLLNLISGIEVPSQGTIDFDGNPFHSMNQAQRDQIRFERFGFVFQQFNLLPHLNVLENVLYPLNLKGGEDAEQKARSFLNRVNLDHRLDHFPETLSGGEKQRVAIARALSGSPELILADEPSGSLDVESGQMIIDLFFDMVKESKASMVLVTHNPSLADYCDKKYFMEKGQLTLA
jgi:putative ABC transport system ATP-binding protein